MPNAKRGNPIFAVRLRDELHTAIKDAAKREGLGIAQWVERAVSAALGVGETSYAAEGRADYRAELDALSERLAAVERALAANGRAAPTVTAPTVIEGKRAARAKAEPKAADAATERNPEWFFKSGRLTDAGKAEVYRRMAAGEADPQIARAMGLRPQSINKRRQKWRTQG